VVTTISTVITAERVVVVHTLKASTFHKDLACINNHIVLRLIVVF